MSERPGNRLEFEGRRDRGGTTLPPSRSEDPPGFKTSRVTRLLCARIYLFGIVASLVTLHRLLGPSFKGIEPGVGYDRRSVLFHAFQSLLFSLSFLVPLGLLCSLTPGGGCFPHFLVGCLFVKIALFNPWMAWVHFRENAGAAEPRMPLLGDLAQKLTDLALPESATAAQNAVYFRGARPFVGYGSEINAWTLVIDTTSKSQTLDGLVQSRNPSASLTASELYRAVVERIRRIQVPDLRIAAKLFLRGEASAEIKGLYGYKYGRPPSTISKRFAQEIDQEGTRGRHYMVLQCENPSQDLVVTQFLRFYQSAKLIFCEFNSYVLTPAGRGLLLLDRLFELNRAVYALVGGALFALAAFVSVAVAGFFEAARFSPFSVGRVLQAWVGFVDAEFGEGDFAVRIVLASGLFLAGFGLLRLSSLVQGAVGMWLGVRRNFGITWSYRERLATRMPLEHFERQEVVRFLKTQEKILTLAMVECLEAHGIDTSDLKESILAFINQGVINSGEIRGNVSSRIRTFFSRKARGRAWRGRPAYAAS